MITTLDGVIAGAQSPRDFMKGLTGTMVAGRAVSLMYAAGLPGAGVAPTPGIGGAVLTSYAGQLPFSNPASGETRLSRFVGQATIAGMLLLCDRLWHNSGITINSGSEQVFTNSAQIPARDINGQNTGVGVFAGLEFSANAGAGTPTVTLKYLNTNGDTKTATNILATAASPVANTFYQIGLAAGDVGIQKAVSLRFSSTGWASGTAHVVLYRVIAKLELSGAYIPSAIDAVSAGFPKIYDNTVPFFLFIPSTTTTSYINGSVVWTQG